MKDTFSSKVGANNSVGGINENTIDNVILELGNNIDDIGALFQEVEMLFYDMNEYFKGEVAYATKEKMSTFSKQFVIAKKNFESYQNDLIKVKNQFAKLDKGNVVLTNDFTAGVNAEVKKIEH